LFAPLAGRLTRLVLDGIEMPVAVLCEFTRLRELACTDAAVFPEVFGRLAQLQDLTLWVNGDEEPASWAQSSVWRAGTGCWEQLTSLDINNCGRDMSLSGLVSRCQRLILLTVCCELLDGQFYPPYISSLATLTFLSLSVDGREDMAALPEVPEEYSHLTALQFLHLDTDEDLEHAEENEHLLTLVLPAAVLELPALTELLLGVGFWALEVRASPQDKVYCGLPWIEDGDKGAAYHPGAWPPKRWGIAWQISFDYGPQADRVDALASLLRRRLKLS
jgi:hypothetical protein